MSLIRLDDISIEFGDVPLLHSTNFSVEPGERICLIGRNGAGKSTLLKIINREIIPDSGELHYRKHLRISQLEQSLPSAVNSKVFDVVREGLSDQQKLIDLFNQLAEKTMDKRGLNELAELQAQIDLAKSLGIIENNLNIFKDINAVNIAIGESNNLPDWYLYGEKALLQRIEILVKRSDDSPYIPELIFLNTEKNQIESSEYNILGATSINLVRNSKIENIS